MGDLQGPQEETRHERDSRRLRELLEETRVAMPGVQVLFAFLLAVPFQQRFAELSVFERDIYVVSLLSSAAATALFVAPSAFHRVRFRRRDKAFLVVVGNRLVIAGLGMLLIAMNSAVFVVASFILDGTTPVIISAATTGVFVLLWFVLGLARGRTAGAGR